MKVKHLRIKHYLLLFFAMFLFCQCTQTDKNQETSLEKTFVLTTETPCPTLETPPTNCLKPSNKLACKPYNDNKQQASKFEHTKTKNSPSLENNSLPQFYEDNLPIVETFDYQSKQALNIQCKKGTKITIPSNAFVLVSVEEMTQRIQTLDGI